MMTYLLKMLVAQFIAGAQTGEIDSTDRLEDFFNFVAVGFRVRVDHLALDQFLQEMQTHHFFTDRQPSVETNIRLDTEGDSTQNQLIVASNCRWSHYALI